MMIWTAQICDKRLNCENFVTFYEETNKCHVNYFQNKNFIGSHDQILIQLKRDT